MKVRVLVCGGRAYKDKEVIYSVLSEINDLVGIGLLIQGWCAGADRIAHQWAIDNGVESVGKKYQITRSMWEHWGRSAGPRRNVFMYDDSQPELVVAFPGSRGTAHMVGYACEASGGDGCVVVVDERGKWCVLVKK